MPSHPAIIQFNCWVCKNSKCFPLPQNTTSLSILYLKNLRQPPSMHLLTPCTGLLCYPLSLILCIISWMTRDDLSLASCVGCSQLACSAQFWCLLHSALSLQLLSDILFHCPHGLVLLAEDPLFNVSNKYWKIASCNDSGFFFGSAVRLQHMWFVLVALHGLGTQNQKDYHTFQARIWN